MRGGHSVLGPDGWPMAAVLSAGSALRRSKSPQRAGHPRRSARCRGARHEVVRVGGSAVRTVELPHTRSLPPQDVTRYSRHPDHDARSRADRLHADPHRPPAGALHPRGGDPARPRRRLRSHDPSTAPRRPHCRIHGPQPAQRGTRDHLRGADPGHRPAAARVQRVTWAPTRSTSRSPPRRVIVELDDIHAHRTTQAFQHDRANATPPSLRRAIGRCGSRAAAA